MSPYWEAGPQQVQGFAVRVLRACKANIAHYTIQDSVPIFSLEFICSFTIIYRSSPLGQALHGLFLILAANT